MEAVEGTRIEKAGAEQRPIDISTSAVETLKRLQALPLAGTGIGDEEPVSLQAEMMRWAMLMQRAPEELTTRAASWAASWRRKSHLNGHRPSFTATSPTEASSSGSPRW